MPYATIEDVQERMPQFQLTGVSKPSISTATTFLNDKQAEVDSALLNMGYVVPIAAIDGVLLADSKGMAQLKTLLCNGVIAMVLYARAAAVGGDASVMSADRHQKMYDDTLCAWKSAKSPKELVDLQRNGDEVPKPTHAIMGLLTDEDGNDLCPRSFMDMPF
jgi:hypothetical protein